MIANTSIEEAKIGESLTQRSYEIVEGSKSHSEIQNDSKAHSYQEISQHKRGEMDSIKGQNAIRHEPKPDGPDDSQDTELMDGFKDSSRQFEPNPSALPT